MYLTGMDKRANGSRSDFIVRGAECPGHTG